MAVNPSGAEYLGKEGKEPRMRCEYDCGMRTRSDERAGRTGYFQRVFNFQMDEKKIPRREFFVKFLSFIHSTDTAGTNFFLLSVNLFLLNINLKFSFSGNIGVTSGMSGSGSSVANFTSFTHNIIDISRIKILGRHSVKSGFRF